MLLLTLRLNTGLKPLLKWFALQFFIYRSSVNSVAAAVLLVIAGPLHAADGVTGLGFIPGGTVSFAHGISADGSVAVGYGDYDKKGNQAFCWER